MEKDRAIVGVEQSTLHFGPQGLERIRNASSEEALRDVLFDVARDYAPYLGLDFDKDVLPNLSDTSWWEAEYGVKEVDGRAIGMSERDAFLCLVDVHRTYQIAQGIKETVDHLKQSKPDAITAIDAGTGTGILSILLAAYGVDTINAIEFNHKTFTITQKFLKRAGLDDRIHIIEGDATEIAMENHGLEKKADILVSENLSAGLMDEPQYDIIAHLSQYLTEDAKIIPYSADLFASVGNVDWSTSPNGRRVVALRRLEGREDLSDRIPFAHVESKVGMEIPVIEGEATLPLRRDAVANTLIISTAFQINEVGKPIYLDSDTAEFLGKSRAFQLDTDAVSSQEVTARLRYRVGRRGEYMHVTSDGKEIILTDN